MKLVCKIPIFITIIPNQIELVIYLQIALKVSNESLLHLLCFLSNQLNFNIIFKIISLFNNEWMWPILFCPLGILYL